MKYFLRAFTPTRNRRLNELIGFLLLVSATLLFLALASYSPLDPSLNTAGSLAGNGARNWIGLFGAMLGDLLLQSAGIFVFVFPVILGLLGLRWFKSRPVASPGAKFIGAAILLIFTPALLALLPWSLRWRHAVPIEGLLGRLVGDVLLHYFNTVGAYIVCGTLVAVALYLSTAFSFVDLRIWLSTRFTFAVALWQRFQDWRTARAAAIAKKKAQKELDRRTGEDRRADDRRAVVVAPMARNSRGAADSSAQRSAMPATGTVAATTQGFERTFADMEPVGAAQLVTEPAQPQSSVQQPLTSTNPAAANVAALETEPAVAARADLTSRRKTVMPKIAAGGYKLPPSSLLHRPDDQQAVNEEEVKALAEVLTEKCAEFDVLGAVTQINPGPVVTTYEFKPEPGVKYSRVTSLSEDLCLAMRAESILIERMPGKSTVGIQVPNHQRETIWLREVVESQDFVGARSKLTLAMGKDINGRIITADLATMPHLLIAGSTGSGKSVAINAMIMSILYKSTPEQVRLILVDPKRLELGIYEGVPHLYVPIITEPKLAANALRNAVREMERRLKVLAEKGVRNLEQYNKLFESDTPSLFEESEHRPLPQIVIIIDELADLMMLDQSNVEESITRLAQMARAVGIHLVLATQRPSVDVITGLIKANFPSRISFRVATKIDSRTILDANGAESLLGKGDMLYLPSGSARVHRLHAPYTAEKEINAVVEFWRAQAQAEYEQKFLEVPKEERQGGSGSAGSGGEAGDGDSEHDELYQDAVRLVIEFGKASTSLLQRRLRIGYGRAAHLIDLMEQDGIVGAADGPKPREVLKKPDWLSEV
ncbi:MAG TPA: DNA translocase FtsK, partial [Candidatus Angelobacter sp.]|nr:DNA translocase FtsK [Candidatus Angelobacter sp.]